MFLCFFTSLKKQLPCLFEYYECLWRFLTNTNQGVALSNCTAPVDRVGANNLIITTPAHLPPSLTIGAITNLFVRFEDTQARLVNRNLRRKLLLASELARLAAPSVLLVDDLPLDDLDAVTHVKKLSKQGTTVVCSMQTYSLNILEKFEKIIVISKKNIIFNGSLKGFYGIFKWVAHFNILISDLLHHSGLFCAPYYNPVEYLIDLTRTEQQPEWVQEDGGDFIVTVGYNGKCNNSGEESSPAVRGKNSKNSIQTQVTKHKANHEILSRSFYGYHGKQSMWTAFSNYNFYQKLNCQRASGENNLTTFLHEEKLKHQRFNWKEFQVFFCTKKSCRKC